ncbi:arabinosyltransferase domain-containing protein [Rhodococcus sp. NPDC058521]|uniref:arabinosyltransferase domain-containing protein n=1 Tax=Rhodococcus sp. NPDC058521 TaxID=3346536 RepID=UPI00365CF854
MGANAESTRTDRRIIRRVAIVSSLVAAVLALAVPFLPVDQESTSLTWPSGGELAGVDAPLVSYAPLSFDVRIPGEAVGAVANSGGVVVSSAPAGVDGADRYGFSARVVIDGQGAVFEIVQRNRVIFSEPAGEAARGAISVKSTAERTIVMAGDGAEIVVPGDLRPQVVGVYTDLNGPAPAGLSVHADIDSRFSSTPSGMKLAAMVLAALSAFIALVALHRLDTLDGRSARRFLPSTWWRFGSVDAVVIGTLVLWHFIGATTSDDGYQFTMARSSIESGYLANYFRWFGVPEAPFGTPYYDLFGLLSSVTTASPWVRLPALILGIVGWLVISREVAPRLGVAVRRNKIALWTGALMFLACWLPYNNGLRPEPAIAIGVLLTWCSVERAIATRRLLPAAVAILIAAFALTSGPSGIICFGALIAGARPIQQIVTARAKNVGYLPLLGPLLAAGLVVLVACFADQTLAGAVEMQRVHAIGPAEPWFQEYKRYEWLLNIGADGSLTRRFGVFAMLLSIGVTVAIMMRRGGRIPGTAVGPSRRLVGITIAAVALMTFTPTKWTHQLGVFAGLAGALAVLTAVAVGPTVLRSMRNRALFAAAVLFLLALCFTGDNAWWYVSAYSVPWWDKPISIAGLGVSTMLLGASVVALAVGGWLFMREPFDKRSRKPGRVWSIAPLTVAAAVIVVISVLSMAKGAIEQYPAFSLAKSNVGALAGSDCGLAEDVLVETDPNASTLAPISAPPGDALAVQNSGFTPNGVAGDLRADEKASDDGISTTLSDDEDSSSAKGGVAGTGGGVGAVGVNGSEVALPFGLDPAVTPVLGSYGTSGPAQMTSGWYALPGNGDLVSIAAAGSIHSVDSDGVVTRGSDVTVEFGSRTGNGAVDTLGSALPIDIGPAPSWRNLRIPLDQAPEGADTVRLVVEDKGTGPNDWVALTPPRVPQTQTLDDLVGSDAPTMIDWAVALQFPCQRPFDHRNGVAEIPAYRILPDRPGAIMTTLWQGRSGGGPLGWIDMSTSGRTIPTYLNHDWDRDWGALEQYEPRDPNTVPAQIETTRKTRSGLWSPPPIITAW